MKAIYRREIGNYLNNPMGYVFLGIFVVMFSSVFCYMNIYTLTSSNISYTFEIIIYFMLVLMPILTMRLMAEEKNEKTDQLLLCAPVSPLSIVYGKFLAAMSLILIALIFTLPHIVILISSGNPPLLSTVIAYFGFLLYCSVYASIGIFISSFTENQVISAVITFAVFIAMLGIEIFLLPAVQNPAIYTLLKSISFAGRYNDFSLGVLNYTSIVYYLSVTVFFNFLTVRVIEKRRW